MYLTFRHTSQPWGILWSSQPNSVWLVVPIPLSVPKPNEAIMHGPQPLKEILCGWCQSSDLHPFSFLDCKSSMPPLSHISPWSKQGFTLLSNIDSEEKLKRKNPLVQPNVNWPWHFWARWMEVNHLGFNFMTGKTTPTGEIINFEMYNEKQISILQIKWNHIALVLRHAVKMLIFLSENNYKIIW